MSVQFNDIRFGIWDNLVTQLRRGFLLGVFVCVSILRPALANEIHTSISPNHVYGLWTQVNAELIQLAESGFVDADVVQQVRQVPLPPYQDRIPANVYAAVNAFRTDMQQLTGIVETVHFHDGTLLEEEMLQYLTLDGQTVTPQTVYLRTIFILEDMSIFLASQTDGTQLLSQYFTAPPAEGKRPGDVFQLVVQAHERLKTLLRAREIVGE